MERLTTWVSFSLQRWAGFYEHPSQEQFQALVWSSTNRLSLLPLAAAVVDRTPDSVPYQGTRLYSYMVVTLIPRFLWPEKPSFSEANQFFQVAYGLTRIRDLDKTSISVGVLAESYIGFGWFGVVGVMFLMGIFLAVFQMVFFMPKSPMVLNAIGIAMLPPLLNIESQLVQYLGGFCQQILVAYLIFLPVTARFGKKKTAGQGVAAKRAGALGGIRAPGNVRLPAPSEAVGGNPCSQA